MAIKITDTTLRDAHQSLMATRMRTADVLPVTEKLDRVGFFSLEAWGGATFDSCIRFLNEDPWERLRTFKSHIPHTPLQMLLRGQNLVGYRHYADDVVEEFVRLAIQNGVKIFRIFDALNDIRNMTTAIRAVKTGKAHVQGTICYTVSPVHTIEKFVQMALELVEAGSDSICVKDMAGLITPRAAFDLIRALKKAIRLPISLHSHCTSGVAPLSYEAAVQAGVDLLDTALGPFSGGTSQPPTESVVAALKNTEFDTGLDLELLAEISAFFSGVREKYQSLLDPIAQRPDVNVFLHQIPGGMLSNLLSQLREQKKAEKYGEVLQEIPRVRKDLGYPPLVTPTSQIVGTQAVLNVILGRRYASVTKEVKEYCLGYYGRTPAPIDPDLRKKIIGKDEPIEGRPADRIKPQLEELKKEAEALGILKREEDLITFALYPNVAPKFLRGELREEALPGAKPATPQSKIPSEKLSIDFKKSEGLVPAIVQDWKTDEVLMVAYMNPESWAKTQETGKACFWSRSRRKLWMKGETSGHVQVVKEAFLDCDNDTLLLKVEQVGGAACHTGHRSCFYRKIDGDRVETVGEKLFDPKEVYGA